MIKKLFKMAVANCNDKDFVRLLETTPKKMENYLKGNDDVFPINLVNYKKEISVLYYRFLSKTMREDCMDLLFVIKPYIDENHPIVTQLKQFIYSNNFDDLFIMVEDKEKYLKHLKNLPQLSACFTHFFNNELHKFDPKYLKAFATMVIDNF